MAEPENQQVARRETRLLEKPGFAFLPKTWEDLYAYAKEIAQTDFVPKLLQSKPGAVLAAWQTGQEVGLPPMAALQSIAIINGRPAIHSNGYWALIVSHPLCEWFTETAPHDALRQGYGECSIKRRGNPHVITRRFTMEEAKTAKLLEKDNWKNYPGDMLQNRARHRAGDDAIPEACQGLLPSDVARDLPPEPRDITPLMTIPQPMKPEPTQEASDAQQDKPLAENSGSAERSPVDATERAAETPGVEKDAAPANKARAPAAQPQKPTLQAVIEWCKKATLEEVLDNSNYAHEQLKGRQQSEMMAICTALNDRKEALQKAAAAPKDRTPEQLAEEFPK